MSACAIFSSGPAWSASTDTVGVDYEYGKLKEVVVGVPYTVFPDMTVAKWALETAKILPRAEADRAIALSAKDSVSTGIYDQLEKENGELIAILESHGVKVLRPDVLSRERVAENFGMDYVRFGGISQQYTRDPAIVVGDNVIENSMGSLYRRSDILGMVKLLRDRLMNTATRWVSMPALDYSQMVRDGQFDKTGFPVLEGGDVIVLGRKVFVGTSANRTTGSSELGYLWLKNYLKPQGYDVERVRLPEDILHLDVVLSVPRPGVIVVCPDAFVDGIPAYFKGWKQIKVTKEETRYLATNGLPIDQDNYIMGYNGHFDNKRIQKELEASGIKVYPIEFEGHTQFGGSIRCSTMPLLRRLEAEKK
jgi:N-dimethylarginine dimethylaminohydrolase